MNSWNSCKMRLKAFFKKSAEQPQVCKACMRVRVRMLSIWLLESGELNQPACVSCLQVLPQSGGRGCMMPENHCKQCCHHKELSHLPQASMILRILNTKLKTRLRPLKSSGDIFEVQESWYCKKSQRCIGRKKSFGLSLHQKGFSYARVRGFFAIRGIQIGGCRDT